jgi:hypothetical protein
MYLLDYARAFVTLSEMAASLREAYTQSKGLYLNGNARFFAPEIPGG